MGNLLNVIVVLLLSPLLYSFLREGGAVLFAITDFSPFLSVGIGFVIYVILRIFLSDTLRLLETLEHELNHAVAKWLLFYRVSSVYAEASGNGATKPGGGGVLVAVAPYWMPITAIPALIVRGFAWPTVYSALDILIGVTLAFHYSGVLNALLVPQTDISDNLYIAPWCLILVFNMIVLVTLALGITANYAGLPDYFRESISKSPAYYQAVIEFLREASARISG